jgi:glycosyltransferase involved in cell wall biosynthesis
VRILNIKEPEHTMKITYLHQYFTTPDMPGGTRSYEMARRLVQMGHDVNMVTSDREGKRRRNGSWYQTEESGIHVHWFPVPYSNKMSYRSRIVAFFKFACLASRKAASIESDVIFATSTPLTIAIPAVYASKKRKVPMVFEVRDLWPGGPIAVGAIRNPIAIRLAQWLERFAYRNSKRIIALSPGMKEGIVSTGYSEERVTVIPNCSDLEMFQVDESKGRVLRSKYHWLQNRPLVIYTGTIGLVNGIDYIARLAASVRSLDSDIRFLVLGTGGEEERVRRLAEELGVLDTSLYMMPPIPKLEVPYWLSAADIATSFVIDNKALWNNSANKFFDALASGTPIAINHGGWQADLLQETDAGLVLEANDTDAAAEKLVNAIHDKPWLTRAGSAARELAKTRFDREQLAIQLESVLRQSVDGH